MKINTREHVFGNSRANLAINELYMILNELEQMIMRINSSDDHLRIQDLEVSETLMKLWSDRKQCMPETE
jgi:protein-arginine kinase